MYVDAEKLIKIAFGEIERVVTANIVVGDPLQFEGKTIIPIVGMSADFGGGGGSGMGKETGESEASEVTGFGTGGGGAGCGFTIKPVALIIIDKDEVRIEQLKVKHLKFERFSSQPPYQSLPQQPSEESSSKSEAVDSDSLLAKEVCLLRRDMLELQTRLGVNPPEN